MNLKIYIKQIIMERNLTTKMSERNISEKDIESYIFKEAKEKAEDNSACIDNETVANWIVHYVEDAYKGDDKSEAPKAKVVTSEPKCEKENNEYSLFDFSALNEDEEKKDDTNENK